MFNNQFTIILEFFIWSDKIQNKYTSNVSIIILPTPLPWYSGKTNMLNKLLSSSFPQYEPIAPQPLIYLLNYTTSILSNNFILVPNKVYLSTPIAFSPQLHVSHGLSPLSHTKNNTTRTIMILAVFDILHMLAQLLVKRSLYLLLIAACATVHL